MQKIFCLRLSQKGFANLLLVVPLLVFVSLLAVYFSPLKDNIQSSLFKKADEVVAGVSVGPEASLSLSQPTVTVVPGQQFNLSVEVRSDNQTINAIDASLQFPANLLEVTSLITDKSDSDLNSPNYFANLWIQRDFDNTAGKVNLMGGVTNPGFKTTAGTESPIFATINFKVKAAGTGTISFTQNAALIDGSGTMLQIITRGTNVTSAAPTPTPTPTITPTSTPAPTGTPRPTSTPVVSKSVIKIYAAGTPADGAYPNMSLLVYDPVRKRWNTVKSFNSVQGNPDLRQFQEFSYEHPTKIGSGNQVRVRFTNDRYNKKNNQDRNLIVDKINLDGIDYQSEAPAVFSTGSFQARRGCVDGNWQTEWLLCNGYFRY